MLFEINLLKFFLANLYVLISVSCLISLSRIAGIMLNSRSKNSIFVSDHKGKIFTILPLSIILAIGFGRGFLSD